MFQKDYILIRVWFFILQISPPQEVLKIKESEYVNAIKLYPLAQRQIRIMALAIFVKSMP
jgi:hypothetical protein